MKTTDIKLRETLMVLDNNAYRYHDSIEDNFGYTVGLDEKQKWICSPFFTFPRLRQACRSEILKALSPEDLKAALYANGTEHPICDLPVGTYFKIGKDVGRIVLDHNNQRIVEVYRTRWNLWIASLVPQDVNAIIIEPTPVIPDVSEDKDEQIKWLKNEVAKLKNKLAMIGRQAVVE